MVVIETELFDLEENIDIYEQDRRNKIYKLDMLIRLAQDSYYYQDEIKILHIDDLKCKKTVPELLQEDSRFSKMRLCIFSILRKIFNEKEGPKSNILLKILLTELKFYNFSFTEIYSFFAICNYNYHFIKELWESISISNFITFNCNYLKKLDICNIECPKYILHRRR